MYFWARQVECFIEWAAAFCFLKRMARFVLPDIRFASSYYNKNLIFTLYSNNNISFMLGYLW